MDNSDQIYLIITYCMEGRALVKQFQPTGSSLSRLQCLPASLISGFNYCTVLFQVSLGLPFPGNETSISASTLRLDPLREIALSGEKTISRG